MILSVIIVVYTEYELAERCIEAVASQLATESWRGESEIILVHNSSPRSGIENVLQKFPQVKYIFNEDNLGFGQAVNVGADKARGSFLLILTPDTLLLPNTISLTTAYLGLHPKVGLTTCRVINEDYSLARSTYKGFPNMWSHLLEFNLPLYKFIHFWQPNYIPYLLSYKTHQRIHFPDHIVGAYLLIRATAFHDVSGFDKGFFLYREETDLCKRLGLAGWKIAYIPIGGALHSADGAVHQRITQASPHYLTSTYTFFRKHYGLFYSSLAWFIGFSSCIISVPFLYVLAGVKSWLGQRSDALFLLTEWQHICRWHWNHFPSPKHRL